MSEARRDKWLETGSATVLSLAALASSWAGYQGSLWDGEQASAYIRANAARIEASRVRLEGDARQGAILAVFSQWLDAEARGDKQLAEFYRSRFPNDMRPAFNAWIRDRPTRNPSALPTPFDMPDYRYPGREQSDALEQEGERQFVYGERANTISDAFGQGATILASALFFAGIGQVFSVRTTRVWLLVVAAMATVLGMARIAVLPLQFLGLAPLR